MREIKFRLRDNQGKIVGYESWHPVVGKWAYSLDNVNWTLDYIPHQSKDQFTGFKDRNLTEIYEADPIEVFVGTFPPGTATGEVIFEDGKFGIPGDAAAGPKFIELAWDISRTIVIGRMHETPGSQGGTS